MHVVLALKYLIFEISISEMMHFSEKRNGGPGRCSKAFD